MSSVSLLIFCLVVLYSIESGVLKSSTIIVEFLFSVLVVFLMYFGALLLGAYNYIDSD